MQCTFLASADVSFAWPWGLPSLPSKSFWVFCGNTTATFHESEELPRVNNAVHVRLAHYI